MNSIRRNGRSLVVGLLIAVALVSGVFVGRATADQPAMQAALASLRSAQDQLWGAAPNKGGHRERALNLVQQAIEEVQKGIDFAR
jgi:hypothetical protein